MLEEHFASNLKSIATDYKSTLISAVELPNKGAYDVRYRDEYEDEYPEDPKIYRVTCQATGSLQPSDLFSYLSSTSAMAMFESKAEILQAMNIVMGHSPKSDRSIASVGASKHFSVHPDSAERFDLGGGLQVLRGFFVSVRTATARLLVNVQVKYAACYEEGPLKTVISAYQNANSQNLYKLESFLKRVKVRVMHIQRKNKVRIKTIAGLATLRDGSSLEHPPRVTAYGAGPKDVAFFLNPGQQQSAQPGAGGSGKGKKGKKKDPKTGPEPAGRYISVADFFLQEYNVKTDPKIPVVNVGTRESPSYLPAEVCFVQPGQPAGVKLAPNQTRNMLNFAVRSPAENAKFIVEKGVQVLGLSTQNETLNQFGIEAIPKLITVLGRVLAAPQVCYKGQHINTREGSWNMRDIKFSRFTELQSWAWLHVDSDRARPAWDSPDGLSRSLNGLVGKLNEMGISSNRPIDGKKIVLTGQNNEEKIDATIAGLMTKKPQLIFTILSDNDTAVYNCVKRICDVRRGVRNICVRAQKLAGANPQYYANVGLKFNLKLGGTNQSLKADQLGIIGEGKTMLVGIDVTHPSPGSAKNAPSIAGIVASVDTILGQWPADIRVQTSRQEMVSGLDELLRSRLRVWAKNNRNAYPENIIVYRDGVSEGQYDKVIDEELPLLKNACQTTYPADALKKGLPRISIIIVGKRHHTRFYPTEQEHADKFNNPKNGTVVDRGVTEARNWDFFLQAHTALKGTARPAHYFTVWDEIFHKQTPKAPFKNAADILESLTHNMCYLFGRATKAVSLCPPAYYADLVCERARCYMSSVFDPTLQATLAASVVSGGAGGQVPGNSEVQIHANVRDTMFYI